MPRASITSRIAHQSCVDAPRLLNHRAPWWEELEEDFHKAHEPFNLNLRDNVRVGASKVFDTGLRTFAASAVGLLALPFGYRPAKLKELRRDAAFYKPLGDAADPEKVFLDPPKNIRVRHKRVAHPLFRPKDGVCEDLTFKSPFRPLNPHVRNDYLKHTNNRTAHMRYWRHLDGPRPTIVFVHGFTADFYHLNEWFFELPLYYRMGCDVALFTLPFHGARQTKYSPFSGHGFFAGGVSRVNEAFLHAVHDFRAFFDYLERAYMVEKLGVTGISLGGFTSALLACAEPRLAFSIPNVPVITIPDLIQEWEPIGTIFRRMSARMKITLPELRHTMAISTPLTYPAAIDKKRLFIIGGVGDKLAPPKHSRVLWDHWNRCQIHWFPGSHIIHLDKGEYISEMAKFLESIDFFSR